MTAIQCPACKKKYAYKEKLVGSQVRCKCGHSFVVKPPASSSGEKLTVSCSACGKEFSVPSSYAGKKAKCRCGQPIQIPAAPSAAASPEEPMWAELAEPEGVSQEPILDAELAEPAPQDDLWGGAAPASNGGDDLWGSALPASAAPAQPANQPRSDNEVLSGYTSEESWRQPAQETQESVGSVGLNGGVLGGAAMMVVAVCWFCGGLVVGYIFFYPPILFVVGLVGLIKGLIQGKIA